ncbi:uncharacterized protein ARMOST_15640 [Armillaria ostoyae]|uniref:Uncharacterized protein n=1 Tax=Armillaria ostoyae TaxID=47428 RepID=A0A284RTX8_ARMOS|nr:uncharacterized protein ARMOST_15640 [Armillaria ostoyae]
MQEKFFLSLEHALPRIPPWLNRSTECVGALLVASERRGTHFSIILTGVMAQSTLLQQHSRISINLHHPPIHLSWWTNTCHFIVTIDAPFRRRIHDGCHYAEWCRIGVTPAIIGIFTEHASPRSLEGGQTPTGFRTSALLNPAVSIGNQKGAHFQSLALTPGIKLGLGHVITRSPASPVGKSYPVVTVKVYTPSGALLGRMTVPNDTDYSTSLDVVNYQHVAANHQPSSPYPESDINIDIALWVIIPRSAASSRLAATPHLIFITTPGDPGSSNNCRLDFEDVLKFQSHLDHAYSGVITSTRN